MLSNLIYDVGMHVGKDTEFYLKKGFTVVAIEANSVLVSQCTEKFSSYIRNKQLHVLNVAIAESTGRATMYVCDEPGWTTMCPALVDDKRRRYQASFQTIEVETVEFRSILNKYGIPYYLKIDIEGSDLFCLKALQALNGRPPYISVEIGAEKPYMELLHLCELGYRQFKYINQRFITDIKLPNPPKEGVYVNTAFDWEMSGPFGEETTGRWLDVHEAIVTHKEILDRYRTRPDINNGCVEDWYDIHAKL